MEQIATPPDVKGPTLLAAQPPSRKERRQLKEQARVEGLRPLRERLLSQEPSTQLEAARELRVLLQGESAATFLDAVVQADLVPPLLQLSKQNERNELEYEVLWVLTHLTTGTAAQTRRVIDQGAVSIFEHLLAAPAPQTREQALTILANIAGASVELRDVVMQSGIVDDVLRMECIGMATEQQRYYDKAEKAWKLRSGVPQQPISVTRAAARCLSCLCQGEPQPALGAPAVPFLSALATLLMEETDQEILVYACKAFASLSYTPFENELLGMDGVDTRLSDLLSHPSEEVRELARIASERLAAGAPP